MNEDLFHKNINNIIENFVEDYKLTFDEYLNKYSIKIENTSKLINKTELTTEEIDDLKIQSDYRPLISFGGLDGIDDNDIDSLYSNITQYKEIKFIFKSNDKNTVNIELNINEPKCYEYKINITFNVNLTFRDTINSILITNTTYESSLDFILFKLKRTKIIMYEFISYVIYAFSVLFFGILILWHKSIYINRKDKNITVRNDIKNISEYAYNYFNDNVIKQLIIIKDISDLKIFQTSNTEFSKYIMNYRSYTGLIGIGDCWLNTLTCILFNDNNEIQNLLKLYDKCEDNLTLESFEIILKFKQLSFKLYTTIIEKFIIKIEDKNEKIKTLNHDILKNYSLSAINLFTNKINIIMKHYCVTKNGNHACYMNNINDKIIIYDLNNLKLKNSITIIPNNDKNDKLNENLYLRNRNNNDINDLYDIITHNAIHKLKLLKRINVYCFKSFKIFIPSENSYKILDCYKTLYHNNNININRNEKNDYLYIRYNNKSKNSNKNVHSCNSTLNLYRELYLINNIYENANKSSEIPIIIENINVNITYINNIINNIKNKDKHIEKISENFKKINDCLDNYSKDIQHIYNAIAIYFNCIYLYVKCTKENEIYLNVDLSTDRITEKYINEKHKKYINESFCYCDYEIYMCNAKNFKYRYIKQDFKYYNDNIFECNTSRYDLIVKYKLNNYFVLIHNKYNNINYILNYGTLIFKNNNDNTTFNLPVIFDTSYINKNYYYIIASAVHKFNYKFDNITEMCDGEFIDMFPIFAEINSIINTRFNATHITIENNVLDTIFYGYIPYNIFKRIKNDVNVSKYEYKDEEESEDDEYKDEEESEDEDEEDDEEDDEDDESEDEENEDDEDEDEEDDEEDEDEYNEDDEESEDEDEDDEDEDEYNEEDDKEKYKQSGGKNINSINYFKYILISLIIILVIIIIIKLILKYRKIFESND